MTAVVCAHAYNSITDVVSNTVQVLSLADHGLMTCLGEFMPALAATYVNTRGSHKGVSCKEHSSHTIITCV